MKNLIAKKFADYKHQAHDWITLATGDYYPDILYDACMLYAPVLTLFGKMVKTSESSIRLFLTIADIQHSWMRDDYAQLEQNGQGKIMVLTLRMLPERLTMNWLTSKW